jgi:hypothetical protein
MKIQLHMCIIEADTIHTDVLFAYLKAIAKVSHSSASDLPSKLLIEATMAVST